MLKKSMETVATSSRPGRRASDTNAVIDPYADTSTPLREYMRGQHEGVTISVLVLDFTKDFFLTKFRNFEKLTGAKIKPIITSQSTWYDDVLSDIKYQDPGFIDLYQSFGNWIPQFADLGGLMDITQQINNVVGLDWFDLMPAVRNGVATYNKKVFAVPIDGDVILMLYRKDLVEDIGLPTPNTWDDVLEILEYYEKKENNDINGDGIPDYGNCFSTAENDIAGEMFWSIASSFLQTKGTSQGVFFDPDTMTPISSHRNDDFIQVLELYKKLVKSSPFRDDMSGVGWQANLQEFEAGRCVLWYNYPGPTRIIVSNQAENNMKGALNLAPLPGMKCKEGDECPFMSEDGANHAPFLASGGMSLAVNSRISEKKQAAALDLALYLSDPAVSFWDVAFPGSFLDPLRQRHTASLANNQTKESQSFLEFGWENRQLAQLKWTTEFNFLHQNYVYDLRILGADEYREGATVPYLKDHWDGTMTASMTADEMRNSWNAITEKYGLSQQRSLYRNVLNLPPYIPPDENKDPTTFIVSFVIPIGIVLIVLIGIVMKQRHTIKYKTRDVNAAPKSGEIVLLFTDIEGSTSLWDNSKTAMSKALEIHHDVVRQCIDKYHAYEVKTIGDAFMIAIDSADRAALLANDIQLNLLHADWPMELASMPSCCVSYFRKRRGEDPHGPPRLMFKGLRVRIGMHMGIHSPKVEEGGQVQILYDKVTKGYDYYGPVANAAARIESLGFGGQTIISREVYNKLSDRVRSSISIDPIGEMDLRGVSGGVFLYQMLPIQLAGRSFTGVYRKSESSVSSAFDASTTFRLIEETSHDEDKTVDVYSLTPIELQRAMKRMQDRVFYLEHELGKKNSYDSSDRKSIRGDTISRYSSVLSRGESIQSDTLSIDNMEEEVILLKMPFDKNMDGNNKSNNDIEPFLPDGNDTNV